jgi:hypothetical protein
MEANDNDNSIWHIYALVKQITRNSAEMEVDDNDSAAIFTSVAGSFTANSASSLSSPSCRTPTSTSCMNEGGKNQDLLDEIWSSSVDSEIQIVGSTEKVLDLRNNINEVAELDLFEEELETNEEGEDTQENSNNNRKEISSFLVEYMGKIASEMATAAGHLNASCQDNYSYDQNKNVHERIQKLSNQLSILRALFDFQAHPDCSNTIQTGNYTVKDEEDGIAYLDNQAAIQLLKTVKNACKDWHLRPLNPLLAKTGKYNSSVGEILPL